MSLSGLPTGTVSRETNGRTYPRTSASDGGNAAPSGVERGQRRPGRDADEASVTQLRRENELLRERLRAREERLQEVIDRYERVIETKERAPDSADDADGAVESSGEDPAAYGLGERLLRAFGLRVR